MYRLSYEGRGHISFIAFRQPLTRPNIIALLSLEFKEFGGTIRKECTTSLLV